jgi:hypothetical protein
MTNIAIVSSETSGCTYISTQFQNPDYNTKKPFPYSLTARGRPLLLEYTSSTCGVNFFVCSQTHDSVVKETESAFCTTYIGVL